MQALRDITFHGWLAAILVALLGLPLLAVPSAATSAPQLPSVGSFTLDFEIDDAFAVTHVAARLDNPAGVAQEVSFELPLSPHAVLSSLQLLTPNGTLVGIVTERAAAQTAYNEAKQQGASAAVLHSAGHGRLDLAVNVQAEANVTIEATYAEIVPLEHGVRNYTFPTEAILRDSAAPADVTINGTVLSMRGWSEIDWANLPGQPTLDGNRSARWTYESDAWHPAGPLEVRITPGLGAYASDLVVSGREGDGAIAATLLPPGFGDALPLDVVFVLDHSGSMAGTKIEQARDALDTILGQLRPIDRFGLVRFDDRIDAWKPTLVSTSAAQVASARTWVDAIQADQATDIEGGVSKALELLSSSESAAVPTVVLITDGLPTSGITDHAAIIDSLHAKNDAAARIHVVGIGFDQDNEFLGELAASTRGFYVPVTEDDSVAATLEGFYQRIAAPALKDVQVTFENLGVVDPEPHPFPDLYQGSQLIVAGRANLSRLPEVLKIRLDGRDAHGPVTYHLEVATADAPTHWQVDRLWAREKASSMERDLQLHPGAEGAASDRAALLSFGLTHQIETLVTSWVLVPIENVTGSTEVAPPPEEPMRDRFGAPSMGGQAQAAMAPGAPPAAPPAAMPPLAPPAGATSGVGGASMTKTPAPSAVLALAACVFALIVARRRRS